MEKTGEIKEGVTPLEDNSVELEKETTPDKIEDHFTKRASDKVTEVVKPRCCNTTRKCK